MKTQPTSHRRPFLLFFTLLSVVFCAVILFLGIRGVIGNPTADDLNSPIWKDEGPLELSPDRGRFALTYSLLEDKSYYFSTSVAKFALPDVAFSNGHYVSLFAPTVSYVIMPGYIIGKYFGVSQVGSFAVVAIFALLNFILIQATARRLGANPIAAMIGALLFVFATPAFPYAVTLYQHHISTFIMLLSIYILARFENRWSLAIIWFLCALSISIDNPNLFIMLPIGVFALARTIEVKEMAGKLRSTIHLPGLLTMVVMILPILFFLNFNKMSYGNPFQLAGTVPSADTESNLTKIDIADKLQAQQASASATATNKKKSALLFFQPRNLPNGLYEHLFSPDRGMRTFTPVMFIGFFGIFALAKKSKSFASLLMAIFGFTILLYSMWGDPYGGWAFGSRYMIPGYAILSLCIAFALTTWRKNIFLLLLVVVLGSFSLGVNAIGALTSNRNPPQVEILALEKLSGHRERYSFTRNMEALDQNLSKSFVFQTYLKGHITAWQYAEAIIGSLGVVLLLETVWLYVDKERV